ncbi:MAG TPA: response regulator [Candidatus Paceibacterota bacterium]|nr:response regulator [Candidatus Paceibacterota bacterium]
MSDIKVLIVEDEHFLSTILANRLKKENFEVSQAFDGQEAIDLLGSQRPDLIILDLILPKKSGFEVLENLSKDPQLNQVPVIILSNLGQQSDIEKARELGAFAYYIKVSTSIDNFVEVVRNVVSSARTGQTPQIKT